MTVEDFIAHVKVMYDVNGDVHEGVLYNYGSGAIALSDSEGGAPFGTFQGDGSDRKYTYTRELLSSTSVVEITWVN